MSLMWLQFLAGMVWMAQWDLGDISDASFGDGGPARCLMGPKQSLERVVFSLKSPFLRGVKRHVLGLQCHQSGCNFWLEWFGWINRTLGTYRMPRFGDGAPTRCPMGQTNHLRGSFLACNPHFRGACSARSWPTMSLKWLGFLVRMVHMYQ